MKGILLISHGKLAMGMADSARLFFGDEIPQMDYLCLEEGDASDQFGERMSEKISNLDTGDGVIVLADLYGGTPCNQCAGLLSGQVDLITGMNFAILVQLLSDREYGEVRMASLMEAGREGIIDVKEKLQEQREDEDDWL